MADVNRIKWFLGGCEDGEVCNGVRRRDHEQQMYSFQRGREDVQRRAAGIQAVFPQAGLGRARCRRNLGEPDGGSRGGYEYDRGVCFGYCRDWNHKPAGDGNRVGQEYRRAGLPCNCVAVQENVRVLRFPERKGIDG